MRAIIVDPLPLSVTTPRATVATLDDVAELIGAARSAHLAALLEPVF
jgi:hypothetical protein